jgi:peptidyl-prolyl cis-trans isomerase SurA
LRGEQQYGAGGPWAGRWKSASRLHHFERPGAKCRTNPWLPTPSPRPLFVVVVAAALAVAAHAEIIDRIAVAVGRRVITTSDLYREIRVVAFLNGVKTDFSAANKRATADRMIEQKLVEQELENGRYPTPQPADVLPALEDFRKRFYHDDADYQRALAEYGITDADVRNALLWQRTLLEFVEVRFRPGVQVTDQQIQDYFDKVVAPAARAAHPGQPVSLSDYRSQIEQTLTGKKEDADMDVWLRDARRRTEVVVHDEALQ